MAATEIAGPALPALPPLSTRAEQTIPGVLLSLAARYGARPYLHHWIQGGWQTLSWGEFAERAIGVATGLISAGVKPGDRVAILSENRLEWLVADLAIQAAGGVTIPIYPTLTVASVQHIVKDSGARIAFAFAPELASKLEGAKPLDRIVGLDELAEWASVAPGAEQRAQISAVVNALDPEALATVIYTSGTTGTPKGVMLAHRNFVEMAVHALEIFDLGPSDRILSFLPFSHVLERMDGIFVPSVAGCEIWLSRGIDRLAEDIPEVSPTVMLGVPRVFEKVHDAVYDKVRREPAWRRALFAWAIATGDHRLDTGAVGSPGIGYRLANRLVLSGLRARITGGSLRFFISGGAPLGERVERFFWVLGVKILQGWGLTESTSGVSSNTETEHRYRTVGKPMPGIEVSVAADGELLVRGPAVMMGYLNDPAATAATIVDGKLRTGDMGVIDAEGFITITDRKKDLIKTSGGKYVAPLPIESRLALDRYVSAALVLGDGRPYVVALIVPDWPALAADGLFAGDPARLAVDERVRAYFQRRVDDCNRELASFETVKRFALLPEAFSEESGELTPTLKPKRRAISERYRALVDALYAPS